METIDKIYKLFCSYRTICTDTRTIQPNSIFFALKGENFDGNLFVEEAIAKGCIGAVTSDKRLQSDLCNIFYVSDTLKALQDLALLHRRTLGIPIIAITGTNGKTTTKELLASVLAQNYRVSNTIGNRNNHIGVPLTLLAMNDTTDIGIVEMGANNIGEIKTLCGIAEPNYGLITNIGKAHLHGFGSIEGVKKTKAELYDYLKQTKGVVFSNIDNSILDELLDGYSSISYGKSEKALCHGEYIDLAMHAGVKWTYKNETGLAKSSLFGDYNFENILAAITVGAYFSIPAIAIDSSIACYIPKNYRSQLVKTSRNSLIMDSYNANPSSMMMSISNFIRVNEKNKCLILGDMLELGEDSFDEHKKLLDFINENKFREVYLVGSNFMKLKEYYKFNFFENTESLTKHFMVNPESGCFFLVKGSRGIKLEKCVDYL
jgi:UDP-N-acetylmuramoyl-tripeptide--D-alanyl-D-alanine ligase